MSNKKLNAIITIGGEVAGSLRTAIGSTTSQLGKIGSEIQRVQNRQRMLTDSIQTFGRMGHNVDNLRRRYSQTVGEIERLRIAQDRLNRSERARLANAEQAQKLYGEIGSTIGTALAVGLPIGEMLSESSEFNYQMQMIGNTADMTKAQIGGLKSEIMAISKELASTPQEVQRAQGFLTAAGLDVGTATKMLRPIGKAAIATGTDIEYAARAAYTLQDSLNIQPDKMIGALDALAQAGKDGNFEFRAMAENLPVLGASFKSLKMEGKEAAATMGAALQIARKGAADEAEAANNMKNFMAKILSPTTLKKADKMGVDLYGAITKAQKNGGNPFEAAMEGVIKATKGGNQKLIGDMFQDMQVQNFLRPMIQQWDDYKKIKESALNADGIVDKDFALISETSKSWGGTVVASFKRMAIAIGDALEPTFIAIATTITPVIDGITTFVQQNPKIVGAIVVALASLTAFKVGWLMLRLAMVAVKAPFLAATGMFARLQAGAAMSRLSFARFIPVIKQIGLALVRTPWGAAAAVAIAAGVMIYKYWDRIKAFFSGFWTGLKQGLEPAIKSFTDLYKSMTWLEPVIQMIGNGIGIVYDWFMKLIAPTKATDEQLRNATSAGESFGKIVGGAINIALAPAKALMGVLEWIHKHIGGVIGQVADLANKAPSVGSFFGSVKSTFGFGAAEQKKPQASRVVPYRTAGPAPQIRGANTKSIAPQQHITQSFTVTAAPGQNPNEIANLVMQKLKSANAVAQRGSMIDAGYSQ